MRPSQRVVSVVALFVLAAAAGGCQKRPLEPLRLKAVELGSAVDAEGRITAPTRRFDRQSTVFVSIATEGGGPATLHVRWMANGQLLSEQSQKIDPDGPTHTVFQLSPANGWPTGKVGAIFWMNDEEKHAAEFEVG